MEGFIKTAGIQILLATLFDAKSAIIGFNAASHLKGIEGILRGHIVPNVRCFRSSSGTVKNSPGLSETIFRSAVAGKPTERPACSVRQRPEKDRTAYGGCNSWRRALRDIENLGSATVGGLHHTSERRDQIASLWTRRYQPHCPPQTQHQGQPTGTLEPSAQPTPILTRRPAHAPLTRQVRSTNNYGIKMPPL